eukprot:1161025-Pelagomonas_calceolata.AAC.9
MSGRSMLSTCILRSVQNYLWGENHAKQVPLVMPSWPPDCNDYGQDGKQEGKQHRACMCVCVYMLLRNWACAREWG